MLLRWVAHIYMHLGGSGASSQSRIDEPSESSFHKTSESDHEMVKSKSGSSSGGFENRMCISIYGIFKMPVTEQEDA